MEAPQQKSNREHSFDAELASFVGIEKAILLKNFGIESSKLITDGKWESQPIDNNNTAEGKANNRRVEFTLE